MNHGQIMEKSQFETHKAQQGMILVGYGACGVSARRIDSDNDEFKDLAAEYETAQAHTVEMKDRVDDASNTIARFFARRRYESAVRSEAGLLVDAEIHDELIKMKQKG